MSFTTTKKKNMSLKSMSKYDSMSKRSSSEGTKPFKCTQICDSSWFLTTRDNVYKQIWITTTMFYACYVNKYIKYSLFSTDDHYNHTTYCKYVRFLRKPLVLQQNTLHFPNLMHVYTYAIYWMFHEDFSVFNISCVFNSSQILFSFHTIHKG